MDSKQMEKRDAKLKLKCKEQKEVSQCQTGTTNVKNDTSAAGFAMVMPRDAPHGATMLPLLFSLHSVSSKVARACHFPKLGAYKYISSAICIK